MTWARALSVTAAFVLWSEVLHADPLKIAIELSATGPGALYSQPAFDGARMALDEANAEPGRPAVVFNTESDDSDPAKGEQVADSLGRSDALAVIGPFLTVVGVKTGPVYEKSGLVSIAATAHGDSVPAAATTFQPIFNSGAMGAALAQYLASALHGKRAIALFRNDAYGVPLADGFWRAATRLGVEAILVGFNNDRERAQAEEAALSEPPSSAVALLTLAGDARPLIAALRRDGSSSTILAPDGLSGDSISALFANEPEERSAPGYFTDRIYAAAPVMLDSADDAILRFARRFRERYGHEPEWAAIQGYDAARLAITAARNAADTLGPAADISARRRAVLTYLSSLDSPAHALPGLAGPLWFTKGRAREQAVRIGRFERGRFESAPLQVVPVAAPSASDIASGAVFESEPGRYIQLQRVVYAGIYLNEISHIDVVRSSFGADFYLWLRYAKDAGPQAVDASEIVFPNILSGAFNPSRPSEEGDMPDGEVYRLWRVQGEFRNEFNLHNFPFDRQQLRLTFFNTRGASDRVIYAVDGQSVVRNAIEARAGSDPRSPIAASTAFQDLSQWRALGGVERRENLVTESELGDPRRFGSNLNRELSGFIATFDVERRALSTVVKSLMPLLLMTLIIYTTLHFPPALIKEKVTVAITGALSGAVLLTAINSQLGGIGYTVAIEYAFYVFFGLTTLTIIAALLAQHWRNTDRNALALAADRGTRAVFVAAIGGLLAGAWWVSMRSGVVP
jgi:ABC-type branched-subunit amino acid transport system substrate-binding protein